MGSSFDVPWQETLIENQLLTVKQRSNPATVITYSKITEEDFGMRISP